MILCVRLFIFVMCSYVVFMCDVFICCVYMCEAVHMLCLCVHMLCLCVRLFINVMCSYVVFICEAVHICDVFIFVMFIDLGEFGFLSFLDS